MDAMIYIVSGLPRSGTSMMMKMLEAGGLPVLIDKNNPSTELNPGGPYAYELTKTLGNDSNWLKDAEGKAVKIIAPLLRHLPKESQYKIIFMERDVDETLVSQQKLVEGRGKDPASIGDAKILLQYREMFKSWLSTQDKMEVLLVDYNTLTTNPAQACKEVTEFIGAPLDCTKMDKVFDSKLYRNRK
jgi:hypothetical protein